MKNKLITVRLLSWLALVNFLLTAAAQPVVTTLPATSVTATNATLHGTVNPNGAVTTAYYQYGLTTNYGNIGAFTAVAATNVTQTMPGFVVNSITEAAGANWTLSGAPGANWQSIASSADGTRLALAGYPGIYTSTNSGGIWTPSSAPIATFWNSIACSADGTRLAAVIYNGGIYTSTNGGGIWTTSSAPVATTNGLTATNTVLSVSNLIGNLAPGTTYHFRLVGLNSAGTALGSNLMFTTAPLQPVDFILNGSIPLPGGAFRLNFTNLSGWSFTVLGTTNLGLPLSNWTVLGAATEVSPGQYQFTDTQVTNNAAFFYRVQSSGNGTGWSAQYYKDATGGSHLVGSPLATRTDATINFNITSGWPTTLVPGIGPTNYSVRWSGQLIVPATTTYTFYTRSDDGVRLYLNGHAQCRSILPDRPGILSKRRRGRHLSRIRSPWRGHCAANPACGPGVLMCLSRANSTPPVSGPNRRADVVETDAASGAILAWKLPSEALPEYPFAGLSLCDGSHPSVAFAIPKSITVGTDSHCNVTRMSEGLISW